MKKTVEIYQKKIYNNIGSSERGGRDAGIAQSVEHFTRNEGVVSSSLISGSVHQSAASPGSGLFFTGKQCRLFETFLHSALSYCKQFAGKRQASFSERGDEV